MWLCVVGWVVDDVLKDCSGLVFGGQRDFLAVRTKAGLCFRMSGTSDTGSHSRRLKSSATLPWKPQISQRSLNVSSFWKFRFELSKYRSNLLSMWMTLLNSNSRRKLLHKDIMCAVWRPVYWTQIKQCCTSVCIYNTNTDLLYHIPSFKLIKRCALKAV